MPSRLLAWSILLSCLACVANASPRRYEPPVTVHRSVNDSRATRPLMFNANGKFQLSVFEDLHLGENSWNSWGHQQDINTVGVIERVLDAEKPDLVVLNGDLITGENAFRENSTAVLDTLVAPLLQRSLPWASTYGNHDNQVNLSAADIFAHEKRWPNARTQSMVSDRNAGVTNYYLPVYGPGCGEPECVPELLLWFFDSRGGFQYQESKDDLSARPRASWVDKSVVDWYRKTQADLRKRYGKHLPSLAFVHIPIHATYAVATEHGRDSIDPHHYPGINDDRPLSAQAQGWCPDGRNDRSCAYGGQDEPFMKAMVETPGLIGLFSGHDHGNSWCYRWDRLIPGMMVAGKGLNLCFGQRSGYAGYGSWERGSRQIRLSRDRLRNGSEAETWIRLDSGDFVGSIVLNSTYGKDSYPETPNRKTFCPTCDYTVITKRPYKRAVVSV